MSSSSGIADSVTSSVRSWKAVAGMHVTVAIALAKAASSPAVANHALYRSKVRATSPTPSPHTVLVSSLPAVRLATLPSGPVVAVVVVAVDHESGS